MGGKLGKFREEIREGGSEPGLLGLSDGHFLSGGLVVGSLWMEDRM